MCVCPKKHQTFKFGDPALAQEGGCKEEEPRSVGRTALSLEPKELNLNLNSDSTVNSWRIYPSNVLSLILLICEARIMAFAFEGG